MKLVKTILPPATIGIMGNGQLGLMLAWAAQRLGYRVIFYSDVENCGDKAGVRSFIAPYSDENTLREFAELCDVITIEFENIPSVVAKVFRELGKPFYPGEKALHVSQNRLREKALAQELGIQVPKFWEISETTLENFDLVEFPVKLKTAQFGYDGKGQQTVHSKDELMHAWRSAPFNRVQCIAEEFMNFTFEFSIIGAQSNGHRLMYKPFVNEHKDGIIRKTAWSDRDDNRLRQGTLHTQRLIEQLEVVGVLAVEFFFVEGKGVVFNEIAPRVHNSGHITMDVARTSQFEQHIRAICGQTLGNPMPHKSGGYMINVIGESHEPLLEALKDQNAKVTIYGKKGKPDRKIGHINYPYA